MTVTETQVVSSSTTSQNDHGSRWSPFSVGHHPHLDRGTVEGIQGSTPTRRFCFSLGLGVKPGSSPHPRDSDKLDLGTAALNLGSVKSPCS